MKITRSFGLGALMLCLILMGTASALSQTEFNAKIWVADGSGWVDSLYFGKYTTATNGIGDSISPILVENELPPVPPSGSNQAPDARFVDPLGGGAYGQGVNVDLRLLVSDGQKDVYRLMFRRTDPEGTAITLSWPTGLGGVGGGGFLLTDGLGGFLFPPVDMTAESSYTMTHASYNDLDGGFVDIVVGDGSRHRTVTLDSLGLATDSKGKFNKAEKPKPWATDFQFTLVVPGPNPGDDILVGQRDQVLLDLKKVTEGTVSFPGDTGGRMPIALSGLKKYLLSFTPPLDSGQLVVVEGRAVKMKKPKEMKGQWYHLGEKGNKFVIGLGDFDYNYQRLLMPNWNNIGDELYFEAAQTPIGLSDQVGVNAKGKPIFRHITFAKKWKDVSKSLLKKINGVYELQDGTPYCLDTLKSKENIKVLKKMDPKKAIRYKGSTDWGNELVGQLIALKFNINMSAEGHTPAQGFGDLIFSVDGHAYDGKTVNEIALMADSAVSCVGGLLGGYTYQDLTDFIDTINSEFSGEFDTVSWSGTKTISVTVATGIKSVAESDIFIGSGLEFAPVVHYRDYSSLYDVPEKFFLSQNYPNPFNPTTTIEFSIPEDAFVTLKVYNMLGQEVATLIDREELDSGENYVDFDANYLSTGVYYYRIVVNGGEFQQVNKMMLIK